MTRFGRRRSLAGLGGAMLLGVTAVAAVLSCAQEDIVLPADRGKACMSDADCVYYLTCAERVCRQRCTAGGSSCTAGIDCSQCECRASVCMPVATDNGSSGYTPPPPDTTPTTTATTPPPPTTCPPSVPITAASIEAMNTWKPPVAIQSACTQQNIDDLRALLAQGAGVAKFTDIKAAAGTTCAACIFAPATGNNWQPVVEFNGATFLQNNTGACLALSENTACGRKAYEVDSCLAIACPTDTCGPDVSKCEAAARAGACKALFTDIQAACPRLADTEVICRDFVNAIVEVCAGGTDGGVH